MRMQFDGLSAMHRVRLNDRDHEIIRNPTMPDPRKSWDIQRDAEHCKALIANFHAECQTIYEQCIEQGMTDERARGVERITSRLETVVSLERRIVALRENYRLARAKESEERTRQEQAVTEQTASAAAKERADMIEFKTRQGLTVKRGDWLK